jgi:hypothetical protein
MRQIIGSELPRFSPRERELVQGSLDFIGINHYSTLYVKDCTHSACPAGGDRPIKGFLTPTGYRDGISIGEPVCQMLTCLYEFFLSYSPLFFLFDQILSNFQL